MHKMNKSEIFKILLKQHEDVTIVKAHILYYRDYRYRGDMAKREKASNDRSAMQYAILETAKLLLSDKMYKEFRKKRLLLTDTVWYKKRICNYDGTPLTDSQIKTRD